MKYFNIILFLCCSSVVNGDDPSESLHFNLYYGQITHLNGESLNEFEQMIKSVYQDMAIPLEIVQSFPATPMLQYQVTRSFGNMKVGSFYAHNATGGRLHYADYSGSATVDHIMDNTYFGVNFQYRFLHTAHMRVFQSNQAGILQSNFEVTEKIKIWDQETSERTSFESTAYFMEPGLELDIVFLKVIHLGGYVGAKLFIYSLPYHLPNNKDAKLATGYKDYVKPDWIEANIALKIGVSLGKSP